MLFTFLLNTGKIIIKLIIKDINMGVYKGKNIEEAIKKRAY